MEAMRRLLAPRAIAVVGASQRPGRGTSVLVNLREAGFAGEVFAVNPRYEEVLGYKCYPSVADLPATVDCIVLAVAANAALDVLDQAFRHGIRAAVVLSAGFGEGGHGEARAARLRALAAQGMCICGPNCYGALSVRNGAAAYSGALPRPLRRGPVALVSQSGGLANNVFTPLMSDRELGFDYVISCGNQLGATIEDYVEYFVADPEITVVAAIVESLTNPQKLVAVAREAQRLRKTLVFLQSGRSAAGRIMVRSHTGALAGNTQILAAFLERCGIILVDGYDEFVEAIALFAVAPRDTGIGRELVVISGSGGGAAIAADAIEAAGIGLAPLSAATKAQIAAAMPEFGSITNPIDGTGSLYDDASLLPKLFDAILADPNRPLIAASISAGSQANEHMRRFAKICAEVARNTGRTIIAYQPSPLGGPLDKQIITTLHQAEVPFLLGIASAMKALRYLPLRQEFWLREARDEHAAPAAAKPAQWDFMAARQALLAAGLAIVDAELAVSEADAIAAFRRFGRPVAVKAEAPGLLHKSDVGCVRLGCASADEVAAAYRAVSANAHQAGFADVTGVLIQPMVAGVTEVFAGIINDRLFGPAICFGLGGIFVEVLKDTTIAMAPLSQQEAMALIHRIKGVAILKGARRRPSGDIVALAAFLVRLGDFAAANFGRFRALDLNPIIVKPEGEGVLAVDIAIEFDSEEGEGNE